MNIRDLEIINNISEIYRDSINISHRSNKLKIIVNIDLDDYAKITLNLKNILDNNISEEIESEVNEALEIDPMYIKKLANGYLFSTNGNLKMNNSKKVYICEDIDFEIQLYDYSKINILEDDIVDEYRIVLSIQEAKNLLRKHGVLGNGYLNEKEKNLIKYAMFIVLLNSSQEYETSGYCSICNIYDIFLQYKNKYEKKEFLEESIRVCSLYENDIVQMKEIKQKIEMYLNEKIDLDTDKNSTRRFDFNKFLESIKSYQENCKREDPFYKFFVDFTIMVKEACSCFEEKISYSENKYFSMMFKHINEFAIPMLREKGFEGEYPNFRLKNDKSIYVAKFIMEEKLNFESAVGNLSSNKFKQLLENIPYEELEPKDFGKYYSVSCDEKLDLELGVENIIDQIIMSDKSWKKYAVKNSLIVTIIGLILTYFILKPKIVVCFIVAAVLFAISYFVQKYFGITKEKLDKIDREIELEEEKSKDRDWIDKRKAYDDDEDEILKVYDMQEEFLKEGESAIAALVMANTKLFKKGSKDLPAAIIYTFDKYYYDPENYLELKSIAHEIYNLGGKKCDDKNLQKISYLIESEVERGFGIKLPEDMTGGREIFFSTVMFHRKYLPGNKIDRDIYPFKILRGKRPDAMLIPYWHWDEE